MHPRARRSGIHRNELDGQVVLYDEASDQVHLLDPSTAAVYDVLDGNRSVESVMVHLAERLRVPADRGLVELALEELHRAHLLEDLGGEGPRPEISRRDLIKRLGLTGALSVLVPAILTVATPEPAAAASCGLADSACLTGNQCCSGQCNGVVCV